MDIKKHGGARKGAGRKKDAPPGYKRISLPLDLDLVEYLDSKTNKSRFINNLVREAKVKEEGNL